VLVKNLNKIHEPNKIKTGMYIKLMGKIRRKIRTDRNTKANFLFFLDKKYDVTKQKAVHIKNRYNLIESIKRTVSNANARENSSLIISLYHRYLFYRYLLFIFVICL